MNQKSKTVVFFGNGPVASESLKLLAKWCKIEFVVTKYKPVHHKDKAPTEETAKELKIPLHFVNNKHDLENLIKTIKPKSEVGIVIDFGVIITQQTIDYFDFGIVNSHFSLLPEWRGADPISFAILSGQKLTGVSLMTIDNGLDTGNLLSEEKLKIKNSETTDSLTSSLIELSDNMLQKTMPLYLENKIKPLPQNASKIATYSVKLKKTDAQIDPNKFAAQIYREIKAYSVWPKSKLMLKNTQVVITKANTLPEKNIPIGEVIISENKNLWLGCKNSTLEILEVKPAGKNTMSAGSFINGYSSLLSN
jgi:methionyl-tRNA formyltransferase